MNLQIKRFFHSSETFHPFRVWLRFYSGTSHPFCKENVYNFAMKYTRQKLRIKSELLKVNALGWPIFWSNLDIGIRSIIVLTVFLNLLKITEHLQGQKYFWRTNITCKLSFWYWKLYFMWVKPLNGFEKHGERMSTMFSYKQILPRTSWPRRGLSDWELVQWAGSSDTCSNRASWKGTKKSYFKFNL